jgi:hypothetical protein
LPVHGKNRSRVGITVRAKKAQPFTKVKASRMSIQERVLYKAAGSSWSLEEIKAIDLMIAGMIRKALKLAPSYPHGLIHADLGGLGLKSFTQLHREHTERSLKRVIAGPEPGASTARKLANRGFRTLDKEDIGLGKGTAVARHLPVETYMKVLLVQVDKGNEKWHRQGGTSGPYLDHIAVQTHTMPQEAYEWVRAWDIQYATELVD